MYEYSCMRWIDIDGIPRCSCCLKKDGKVVLLIPNAFKDIGEKNMIGMYKARLLNK